MIENQTFLSQNKQGGRVLNEIEPRIKELISSNEFYVIRRKKSMEPLNISYSRVGLRWTTDRFRNLLYFKNAQLRHKVTVTGEHVPYFYKRGNDGLEKNSNVIIEKFIPMDHYRVDSNGNITNTLDSRLQVAEYLMVSKALKMLYWIQPDANMVYSSDEEIDTEGNDFNNEIILNEK